MWSQESIHVLHWSELILGSLLLPFTDTEGVKTSYHGESCKIRTGWDLLFILLNWVLLLPPPLQHINRSTRYSWTYGRVLRSQGKIHIQHPHIEKPRRISRSLYNISHEKIKIERRKKRVKVRKHRYRPKL